MATVATVIAAAHRAEQSVGYRMSENVGVGMTEQALVMGNLDAAQNELTAFGERVNVHAQARLQISHVHSNSPSWDRKPYSCPLCRIMRTSDANMT